MLTIYEVIYGFFEALYPDAVFAEYVDLFEPLAVVISLLIIFQLILLPLWKIATYLSRRIK